MGIHTANPVVTTAPGQSGAEIGRVVVTLVGGGALALCSMRVDIFPPINQPQIYVFTNYGGYDPGQMEGLLVSPFEIVLGLLAVLGLIDRTGWLTRLAGSLGVILFALFAIEIYRSSYHDMQAGVWAVLGGAVMLIFAGLIGLRPVAELPAAVDTVEK